MTTTRRSFLIGGLSVVALFPNGVALAQSQTSQQKFAVDLTKALFSRSEIFEEVASNQGWRGVVPAAPGSSIAPITEAYSGLPGGLSQALANVTVFDRPVSLQNGYAAFGTRPLDEVWGDILADARPPQPLPKDRMLQGPVMKWLFKPIYKKNKVVGFTREPSRYVLRYREYEALYGLLLQGQDSGLWNLDSRLRKYATFQEAHASVLKEWYKSGFKAEVESATWSFQASAQGGNWLTWAKANEAFEAHRAPVDTFTVLPETYLFPPPASWSSVSSWIRAVSKTDDGEYRFQLARVKVERPWMDLDALVSGGLGFPTGTAAISTGEAPTESKLPEGSMSAIIEELIIVRDVHLESGSATNENPLSLFAYPDSINLVGFVVRILPQLPWPGQASSQL